ncbi:hypothetical protein JTB14_007013 [Gonioctena quinquepunctata]|nr:hypothetical protein JTB14_007013 [Gonioctena quinquepunctata]
MSTISDDREEGEIVDDDFEDISDNSIIEPLYTGKSVSTKEHLQAISLSSVSDSDVSKKEEKSNRPKTRRKGKCLKKRRCRHERRAITHSDSDDCKELNRKLRKQLKAAVHVESEECHRNSLRSRLRAMTKLNNSSDEMIEKSDKEKSDQKLSADEGDIELIQLRLEALRTAVLNKFEHRKKRKAKDLLEGNVIQTPGDEGSENNKENTDIANEIHASKKPYLDKSVNEAIEILSNPPPDEDEDVLRALLLASMSKKITKTIDTSKSKTVIEKCNLIVQNINKTENIVWPTQTKVPLKKQLILKNNPKIQSLKLPKVKPIIINVDDDSESEDDSNKNEKNSEKTEKTNEIESTVERFLKEQRAKVEAQSEIPPKPKAPNGVKPTVSAKPSAKTKILEKSSLRLLPKVKQLEYQKLLLKLKNAERRPRVRRASFKVNGEGKSSGSPIKKFSGKKLPLPTKTVIPRVEKAPDITSDARVLHIALKEMQSQKNGRLQIEEKYVVLTPIIKKINEATTERKKYDQEVKRLLEELDEAKKKLHTTHINFSNHVKQLIAKKKEIENDKPVSSGAKTMGIVKKLNDITPFTSTPKKDHHPIEALETSSIHSATPNNSQTLNNLENSLGVDKKCENIADSYDVPTVFDNHIILEDPNDIITVCGKQSAFPKYISPLDYVKRKHIFDPLAITCPYDIDGNCRDAECIYKHFSR